MQDIELGMFSSGLPIPSLMEKVGQSMALWFKDHADLIRDGVVVLVGPGHNGGDGLVVARELYLSGVEVRIFCPIPINKKLTANHLNYATWLGIEKIDGMPDFADKALWIDALFGLGQSRPLPRFIEDLFQRRQDLNSGRLISLDVPSGICSDSGRLLSDSAAFAAYTLTVGLIKKGLVQDSALPYVGRIIRIDIGIPSKVLDALPNQLSLRLMGNDIKTFVSPKPNISASKYQRGRVLILAGSDRYRGAGLLALKGAIASGAGSIQAAIPKSLANSLWQVAPEVVLAETDESTSGFLHIGKSLNRQDLGKIDALLIGPGLGPGDEDWKCIREILNNFSGLLVLDADGINRVSESPEGWEWIANTNCQMWLTPHIAEFTRLFPDISQSSIIEAVTRASELSGASILLKGAHSVIAAPSGKTWQLGNTAPWTARTGTGDLLAGFVAGLGALEIAALASSSCELFAAAALLHAEASLQSKTGSSPSCIEKNLSSLTHQFIQGKFQEAD